MNEQTANAPKASWETVIRASDLWPDRMSSLLVACAWVIGGGYLIFGRPGLPIRPGTGDLASAWMQFTFWAVGSVAFAAGSAWQRVGLTKLTVLPDELVVSHWLGSEVIYRSRPMKTAAIRDAFIQEREYTSKGGAKWRRWNLMIVTKDGEKQRVVSFPNSLDAEMFMCRFSAEPKRVGQDPAGQASEAVEAGGLDGTGS